MSVRAGGRDGRRTLRLMAGAIAAVALLASGCFRSVSTDCESDGDCYEGETCRDGTCVSEGGDDGSNDTNIGDSGDSESDSMSMADGSEDSGGEVDCKADKTSECAMNFITNTDCDSVEDGCCEDSCTNASDCRRSYCKTCICEG